MEHEKAKHLGTVLRDRREHLRLSTTQVAAMSGIPQGTVVRIEQGEFASPKPDKLARLADALGLKLADVFALADYAVPTELPSVGPYLRTKYRDLPSAAIEEIQQEVAQTLRKYGVEPNGGPVDGEDETPEDT